MSNGEVLEEIREIIEDRRMKATGKLDAISDVLEEAGLGGEDDNQDDDQDHEEDDEEQEDGE